MSSRTSVRSAAASEDGITLIEVLVAMMIFAMLVVGIGYSLMTVLQMTRDSQARETAISLASSELDMVRAIGDPFQVLNVPSRTQTVGTNTYTIKRDAAWVTPDGNVDTCGTGGGPLQYKSVTVSVSWVGMREGSSPVRTDTALMPTTRINDPSKGTILVSVIDEAGLGNEGITFTATSSSGNVVTTATNSDGCSFVLGVPPGDYTVKLTNSGYMGISQEANPTVVRTVDAGASAQFQFQYDKSGTYSMNYASNDTTPLTPKTPNDMDTTYFNVDGQYTTTSSDTIELYPHSSGYEIVAGNFVPASETGTSCEAVDPAAWPDDTTKDPVAVATRAATAHAAPNGSADTVGVPMGILTVEGTRSNRYLYAVSQNAAMLPGQPSCGIQMVYSFGSMFSNWSTTTAKIALPFGSWVLYASDEWNESHGTANEFKVTSGITLLSPGVLAGDGSFALDPRGVTP